MAEYIERYRLIRYNFFWWRYRLGAVEKVALSVAMAAFTGLTAQVWIPHPFTPVPITAQVFAVLLAGVLLGRWYGGLSQAIYGAVGAAGVPWFAAGGAFKFMTAGYIVGFVVAAFAVGWLIDRYVGMRRFFPLLALMMVGVGIIYLFGATWFSLYMGTSLLQTVLKAAVYFIPVDLAKAVAVAAIAHSLLPKTAYDGEVDGRRYQGRRY